MKLHTLALAVLAATVSVSATADVNLSGMARANYSSGYQDDQGKDLEDALTTKVELNMDASAEANGITYFGHAQIEGTGKDSTGTGNSVSTDDIYVGMKGGFGEVRVGDTDNGCDATDVGGYSDNIEDANVGGCAGGDQNNITYIGTAGAVTYAASFGPNTGNENFSVGAKGKFGPATVSLGHTAGDDVDDSTVLGLAGAFGPVGVGLRVTDADSSDDIMHVISAKYASGANTFAIGHGSVKGKPERTVGYWTRDLGANTALTVEAADIGGANTLANLRLQHNF